MTWWSLRVGRRGRVSKRGVSVGVGRARVGAAWPKAPKRPAGERTSPGPPGAQFGQDEEAEFQEWLAGQPDDVKLAALEARIAEAEKELGLLESEDVTSLSDEQAERELADEIRTMKDRDPREWVRLLASLPEEQRAEMREIEAKFDL